MSHATFTFGRFNPPTEAGHGKLVAAVQAHAKEKGGAHYIFPSHSQDKEKNPLSHSDKVGAMKSLFPKANIVSHPDVKTAIHALKHLESKGHTHATMVVGSDRTDEFHKLLNSYNGKEYNFKKIDVKSAGRRDPNSKGSEGMSASKLRGLAKSGKRDEFISHYSDKKVGADIHDKVKKAMNESKAMFILGGPGSGKDYVINNILKRYDMVEVQMDQILNGAAVHLIEKKASLLINGNADSDKIQLVKSILEDYDFSHTVVTVTNKVSRLRNETRDRPLNEQTRIRKWLDAANIQLPNTFVFDNSINLMEASATDLTNFQGQIAQYLKFLQDNKYTMKEVLEYGTDETAAHYRNGTPGQGIPVDTKPKLTLKGIRKRGTKGMPPKAFDSRIGGTSNFDGVGSYSGGAIGGAMFANSYKPHGKMIKEKKK